MLTYVVKRLSYIIISRNFSLDMRLSKLYLDQTNPIDTALDNLHSINYLEMSLTIFPIDI